MTLYNLAVLDHHQGRHETAKARYRRALTSFGATLDGTHPHVMACRSQYEDLLRAMGGGDVTCAREVLA
jgi:hypothetical protein